MHYTPAEQAERSLFSLAQDVKLLGEHVIGLGANTMKDVLAKREVDPGSIDWFLPHTSSKFFVERLSDKLSEIGISIPQEKWFTNLPTTGNVGSASIYLMLGELFNSGKLKKGEKIMIVVPESARFSYVYGMLTVV
jgi:3-oxoacyl-[acyl-carrier-protein] synthase-3